MTILVACLLTGKGTWSEVNHLINSTNWERIILITNNFGKEKYTPLQPDKTTLIIIDEEKTVDDLTTTLLPAFNGLFGEVAVNIASGSGKTHMAVITALLKSGAGIRFIQPTPTGFKEI